MARTSKSTAASSTATAVASTATAVATAPVATATPVVATPVVEVAAPVATATTAETAAPAKKKKSEASKKSYSLDVKTITPLSGSPAFNSETYLAPTGSSSKVYMNFVGSTYKQAAGKAWTKIARFVQLSNPAHTSTISYNFSLVDTATQSPVAFVGSRSAKSTPQTITKKGKDGKEVSFVTKWDDTVRPLEPRVKKAATAGAVATPVAVVEATPVAATPVATPVAVVEATPVAAATETAAPAKGRGKGKGKN